MPLVEVGNTECGAVQVEGRDQGLGFRHGKFEALIRKPDGDVDLSCMYEARVWGQGLGWVVCLGVLSIWTDELMERVDVGRERKRPWGMRR